MIRFPRILLNVLAIVAATLPIPAVAQEAPGIGLVVGAVNYRAVPPVVTARDDAQLVASGLRNTGMAVRAVADTDAASLRDLVAALAKAASPTSGAFFYFRGHIVQAPARDRSDGIDNWMLGIDEAGPTAASLSLGDVLALFNAAGVTRQVIVLDDGLPIPGLPVGFAAPGARALRRSVIVLSASPGEPGGERTGLASALAAELGDSRAPAGEMMLRIAGRVAATHAGTQRPLVAGSGASSQWVLNPNAKASSNPPDDRNIAMVKRYREAITCGSRTCLAAGANAVTGSLRIDLEQRLAAITPVDDFDPGAVVAARPRAAPSEAVRTLIGALATDARGKYQVGLWSLQGQAPFPQDDETAFTYLTEATRSNAGGVPSEGEKWYRDKANFVLGWFYHIGRLPATKDSERAVQRWGGTNANPTDADTAWYLANYAEKCIANALSCQASRAKELYAVAVAQGVTRARSPLDPDFPTKAPQ